MRARRCARAGSSHTHSENRSPSAVAFSWAAAVAAVVCAKSTPSPRLPHGHRHPPDGRVAQTARRRTSSPEHRDAGDETGGLVEGDELGAGRDDRAAGAQLHRRGRCSHRSRTSGGGGMLGLPLAPPLTTAPARRGPASRDDVGEVLGEDAVAHPAPGEHRPVLASRQDAHQFSHYRMTKGRRIPPLVEYSSVG